MRAAAIAMLVASLALCGGQTFAQPAQSAQRAQAAQPSLPTPPSRPSHTLRSAQQRQLAHPLQLAQLSQSVQPAQSAQPPQPAQPVQPPQPSLQRYSADGLYNLANSYARAGKPGLAVLNYERAALLAPGDPDINANLQYVRASAHVPTEPPNRFQRIARAATPAQAAWIGVLGLVFLGAGLLAAKMTRRFRWVTTCSIPLGIALITLAVSNAALLWPRMHAAVVLVNQTPARVSPVPMGDTAFVLPEAETVTMTAEHEDFVLIRTRAGQTGWVARANLGAVVPQSHQPIL